MNGSRLIFFLALCFICVSSNDQTAQDQYSKVCEMHNLSAQLGSSVLLPCNLRTSNTTRVSWAQTSGGDLVLLRSDGRIQFTDPRYGRVKAFPNQGSEGNFSIRIDELQNSDLGFYFCTWEDECIQVDLFAEEGTPSRHMRLMIYVCVSVAVIMLMCVGGYFCMKCTRICNKTPKDNAAGAEEAYDNDVVYENDDQNPANQQGDQNRNQCTPPAVLSDPDTTQPSQSTSGGYQNSSQFKFVRMERQSTKRRFHTELFNRIRQASSRHYYVNRGELSNQRATQTAHFNRGLGKRRAQQDSEYNNPIYNRSTERLDQM
ncbi:uncharacterized protein LOC117825584 [Notolabrus celidotus]|uniref:uncharacterized protein LOC117825584 n=1 Tax=Notolabrus celidotus TaxID=1203425 RepID=UPI00148F8985|nr:uncharacterized protein LOC117825584 [Notolabrus celidotus]